MATPKNQVYDVNHFDNKIVVKYEDGTVTLLDGEAVRQQVDTQEAETPAGDACINVVVDTIPSPQAG